LNRLELAHLLRAACTITGDRDVLVLGSQSILGSFEVSELPERGPSRTAVRIDARGV
jgi:hypothetical protein